MSGETKRKILNELENLGYVQRKSEEGKHWYAGDRLIQWIYSHLRYGKQSALAWFLHDLRKKKIEGIKGERLEYVIE